MTFVERLPLIRKLEKLRGSKVICYLTSLRQNILAQMAEDAVRVFFDHLLNLPNRKVDKLDIFLCSNGGSGTVPWRLVSLFREFAKSFNVLIPYRAYSAPSLLALGADEIVMHPFAELGPIDPTVANDFNPIEQGRRLGISVEDVTAYVNFIKETVGVTHEDELVKAIEILANKVHPLALGNVERFIAQSRMIARKILRTHMRRSNEHTIDEIIENMASRLYFHGHPINRREAKEDLRLKIIMDAGQEIEDVMWDLYRQYEDEFENLNPFYPPADLPPLAGQPPGAAGQPPPAGGQPPPPAGGNAPPPVSKDYDLLMAVIECTALSSKCVIRKKVSLFEPQPNQRVFQEEVLAQGWNHTPAPPEAPQAPGP